MSRPLPLRLLKHIRPTSTDGRCDFTLASTSSPSPFTPSSISRLKTLLRPRPSHTPYNLPPHTVRFQGRDAVEAAVLIPLMNIGEGHEPCILLEVRSGKLRTHAGEVSFPGGRMDPTDRDLVHTAQRETQEELAIPPSQVEILGMLDSPEYSLGNKSRVWPIVGFVHPPTRPSSRNDELKHIASTAGGSPPSPSSPGNPDKSLASFPLSSLRPSLSEVSAVFPLPLSALLDSRRHTTHYFRLDPRKPYHKIRVGDLIAGGNAKLAHDSGAGAEGVNDPVARYVSGGKAEPDAMEVWGLTGWFLNCLAWKAGWMDRPQAGQYEP